MDCINFVKKGNKFVFDSTEYEKFKGKGNLIIHWLPADKSLVDVEVLMPDTNLVKGLAEEGVKSLKSDEVVQFERFGFCRLDKKEKDKSSFWYTHK
jgi:glutamyl-tRNA synthetase